MMPELNGYEVLERLRADERLRHVPVIMISAVDQIESVVRCIELGAEDYLPKPFNPMLLRARVGACLEKKRLREPGGALPAGRGAGDLRAAAAVEAETFDGRSCCRLSRSAPTRWGSWPGCSSGWRERWRRARPAEEGDPGPAHRNRRRPEDTPGVGDHRHRVLPGVEAKGQGPALRRRRRCPGPQRLAGAVFGIRKHYPHDAVAMAHRHDRLPVRELQVESPRLLTAPNLDEGGEGLGGALGRHPVRPHLDLSRPAPRVARGPRNAARRDSGIAIVATCKSSSRALRPRRTRATRAARRW